MSPDDGGDIRPDVRFYENQQRQQGQGPQQAPAWSRAARLAASAVPAAALVTVLMVGMEFISPPSAKPSKLLGDLMGHIHAAEINAQQPTVVENTYRMADAQAKANADYQTRILAYQQQQAALMEALKGKIAMANGADMACGLAQAAIFFYGPNTQGGQTARGIAATSCAYAANLRQQIADEQAQLSRTYALLMQQGGR